HRRKLRAHVTRGLWRGVQKNRKLGIAYVCGREVNLSITIEITGKKFRETFRFQYPFVRLIFERTICFTKPGINGIESLTGAVDVGNDVVNSVSVNIHRSGPERWDCCEPRKNLRRTSPMRCSTRERRLSSGCYG